MVDLTNVIRKNRGLSIYLGCVFLVFVGFHFWKLSVQEFTGDEAAPMLNIDRALDAFDTGNIAYLAYPFLWHHEPLRAVIEGGLLHFFGVGPVLLRLPNILFNLASFWVLVGILWREKVDGWLLGAGMSAYATAAILMIGRLSLTDGYTRVGLLLIAYLCYGADKDKSIKKLIVAVIMFVLLGLRVLDSMVMIVPMAITTWRIKAWKDRRFMLVGTGAVVVMAVYFGLWMLLPYSAYKMGLIEDFWSNGLFYYLGRASDGSVREVSFNFQILRHYSSSAFAIWLLGSFGVSGMVPKLRRLLLVSLSPLVAVYGLFSPSIHITSYVGIFFWQAMMAGDYLRKKYVWLKPAMVAGLVMVGLLNLQQLQMSFWSGRINSDTRFVWGHADVPRPGYDLDEAVKRIYLRHGVDPEGRVELRNERWGATK